MADEIVIFDQTGSNPDGTNPGVPFSIGPGTSYNLVSYSYPAPEQAVLYASSIDTEGDVPVSRRYQSRTITLEIEMNPDGTDAFLKALQGKFAKLQREGGTLHRTMKNGDVRIYDIMTGQGWDPVFGIEYVLGDVAHVTITLPCKPLSRGASVQNADRVETTLPVLVATETGITGDVDALGLWLIDNDASLDWWGLLWGTEIDKNYTFTTSASNGSLYYEAESRAGLSGATAAVGSASPSGAGSNVMRSGPLTVTHQAVMGTGSSVWHVGTFRVFARVYTPSTNVNDTCVAFEYTQSGSSSFTRNTERVLDASTTRSRWMLVDLGIARLPRGVANALTWEGRIIARALNNNGVGNIVDIDYIFFVPCEEAAGEASAILQVGTPTAFLARDAFDQTAGALTGKTLPVGGTWTGAGDADDFNVSGSGTMTRTAISDVNADTGRYVTASTPTMSNTLVSVDVTMTPVNSPVAGVIARYTDVNNWLMASASNAGNTLSIKKRVAGTVTTIATGTIPSYFLALVLTGTTPLTLTMLVDANGRVSAWVSERGAVLGTPIATTQDSALATGGTLATGKPGIYDVQTQPNAATRTYDNFMASAPTPDAAVFTTQSIQIRHDGVVRENTSGSSLVPVSSYRGDYLTITPEAAEGRDIRFIAKPIYHPAIAPGVWPDDRIDDISGRVTFIPRYLS